MPTHHTQTALRYAETLSPHHGDCAIMHAQLETAAQIERIADTVERIGTDISNLAEKVGRDVGLWLNMGSLPNPSTGLCLHCGARGH
jgi:hypothetical protein